MEDRTTHRQQSAAIQHTVQILAEQGFEGMGRALEILLNDTMMLERTEVLRAVTVVTGGSHGTEEER